MIWGFIAGWLCCWVYYFVFRYKRTEAKVRRKLELMAECVIPSDILKEVSERKSKKPGYLGDVNGAGCDPDVQ